MQFSVIRADESITHIALAGRLDIQGLNAIQDRFVFTASSRHKPTLVDLSQVTFLASLAMGMLVSTAKTLQHRGVKMVIVQAPELVQKALEAAGIQKIIPMVATESEALRMLA